MNRWRTISVALVILMTVALLGRAQQRPPVRADDVRQKAEARVKAALEVVAALQQREEAGEPLTPEFVERKLRAHRKLAESRLELAANATERLQAAQAYLEQAREFAHVMERRKGQDVGRLQLAEAQYHIAEAEHWIAKIKAGP